jgi:16S rRNA G966 N2-methylase RsmD
MKKGTDIKINKFLKTIKKIINNVRNKEEIFNLIDMYLGVSEDEKKLVGEVFTSFHIVRDVLSNVPKDFWTVHTNKVLDNSCGIGNFEVIAIEYFMEGLKEWEPNEEKRYKHIIENQIHVCELQTKNMFSYLNIFDPKCEYNMKYYRGSFFDKEFDYCMKNVWNIDKFDLIFANPPFNQMIDMDFLSKSYDIADKVVFIHPSTWLLDEKNKQKKFVNIKNKISEHLEKITLFNANKSFNIQLFVPCVITYVNKDKKIKGIECIDRINDIKLIYENINQINKFSNISIYPKLKQKIKNYCDDNLYLRLKDFDNIDNFYVNLSQLRGNVDLKSDTNMLKSDFYTMCTKNLKVEKTKRKQREKTQAAFSSEKNANNFLNYVKLDFVRFCLSINKNNQNLYCGEMSLIPWLDFSQEWTDEKLYKMFDLTQEEIDFINKHIPKYY